MSLKAHSSARLLLGALGVLSLVFAGVQAASAQVATNMYGQAQLLPPGVEPTAVDYQGPRGTATFVQAADGGSDITIDWINGQASTTYVPEIHNDSCGGAVTYTLNPFTVGADGTASALTHIPDIVHTNTTYLTLTTQGDKSGNYAFCGQIHVIMTAGGGIGGGVAPGGTGTTPPGMPATGEGQQPVLTALILAGSLVMTVAGLWIGGLGRRAYNLEKRR